MAIKVVVSHASLLMLALIFRRIISFPLQNGITVKREH